MFSGIWKTKIIVLVHLISFGVCIIRFVLFVLYYLFCFIFWLQLFNLLCILFKKLYVHNVFVFCFFIPLDIYHYVHVCLCNDYIHVLCCVFIYYVLVLCLPDLPCNVQKIAVKKSISLKTRWIMYFFYHCTIIS